MKRLVFDRLPLKSERVKHGFQLAEETGITEEALLDVCNLLRVEGKATLHPHEFGGKSTFAKLSPERLSDSHVTKKARPPKKPGL